MGKVTLSNTSRILKEKFNIELHFLGEDVEITHDPLKVLIQNSISQLFDDCEIYIDENDVIIRYSPILNVIYADPFKSVEENKEIQDEFQFQFTKETKYFKIPISYYEELILDEA